VAAAAALLGFVLGTKGASRKRPIIGGGFSLLSYVLAAVFGWWGVLELVG